MLCCHFEFDPFVKICREESFLCASVGAYMDEMLPKGSNGAHNVVTVLFMVDRNTFPPILLVV